MANDDQPGYSGRDLISGAAAAVDRRPDLQPRLRDLLVALSGDDHADALDPRLQELLALFDEAGVPRPPVHAQKPPTQR